MPSVFISTWHGLFLLRDVGLVHAPEHRLEPDHDLGLVRALDERRAPRISPRSSVSMPSGTVSVAVRVTVRRTCGPWKCALAICISRDRENPGASAGAAGADT